MNKAWKFADYTYVAGTPDERVCLSLYDPVCGEDGMTYGNSCEAEQRGVRIKQKGVCPSPAEAYFLFHYPPRPETFVIRLTDPNKIVEARNILADSSRRARHVIGTIIKKPADYNPPWNYHLDPASISFFESAIEVCDAGIRYVEEHLAEVGGALLPGNRWCPWGSELIRELNRASPVK